MFDKHDESVIIQKIDKKYVGEDCAQVMFGYKDGMHIFEYESFKDIYHHFFYADEYINKYVCDERRHQFPYSDTPIHKEIVKFKEYTFANVLLDFDKIYSECREFGKNKAFDGYCKVLKDGEDAILIQDVTLSRFFSMSLEEIKCFNKIKTHEPKIRTRK